MTKKQPAHACPVCGHPVGAGRYFWRPWIWARWHCGSCGTLLRFDSRRRIKLAVVGGFVTALTVGVTDLCVMNLVSPVIWALPVLAFYIAGTFYIFLRYDRIIVAEESKEVSHALPNDA